MSEATLQEAPVYKYTFKLKAGSHHDRKRNITIETGGLYQTNDDMVKLHGKNRWELVKGDGVETMEDLRTRIRQLEAKMAPVQVEASSADELDRKSIKELREMAAKMEPPVDLTTCTGKDAIVNAIRQALDAA